MDDFEQIPLCQSLFVALPNKLRTELMIYRDRSRLLIPFICKKSFENGTNHEFRQQLSVQVERVFFETDYVKNNLVFDTYVTDPNYLTVISPEIIAKEGRETLFSYLESAFPGQLTIFQYFDNEIYAGKISEETFRLLIECKEITFKLVQDSLMEVISQEFGENFIRPIVEKVNDGEETVLTPRNLFESLLRDSDPSVQEFLNSPLLTRTTGILLAGLVNTVIALHMGEES